MMNDLVERDFEISNVKFFQEVFLALCLVETQHVPGLPVG